MWLVRDAYNIRLRVQLVNDIFSIPVLEIDEDLEEPCGMESNFDETEAQEYGNQGDEEVQHGTVATQGLQPSHVGPDEGTVQKRQSSFCLNMEFGQCGGMVSCKGGFSLSPTHRAPQFEITPGCYRGSCC